MASDLTKILEHIGNRAITYLRDNIERKINLANGDPFEGYSYNYWLKKKNIKRSKKESPADFTAKHRNEWLSDRTNVTLVKSGAMLQSMMVINVDASSKMVRVGFANTESAEIAFYHNISGAGKGRIIRRFMQLTNEQKGSLEKIALEFIDKNDFFLKGVLYDLVGSEIKKAQ